MSFKQKNDDHWYAQVKANMEAMEKSSSPSVMQQIIGLIDGKQKASAKQSVAEKVQEMQERAGFVALSKSRDEGKIASLQATASSEEDETPLLFKYAPDVKPQIVDKLLNKSHLILDIPSFMNGVRRDIEKDLQDLDANVDEIFDDPKLAKFVMSVVGQSDRGQQKKPITLSDDIEFSLEDVMDSGDLHKALSPAGK
jgi:hypothetical protein